MRILLTGASGFTGRHFLALAKKNNCEVFALQSDLVDRDALFSEVRLAVPTHVLHLAGISAVTHSNLESFYQVNVLGTQNLLSALSALPNKPDRIVLASSANIYGNSSRSPLVETDCPQPVNHYAISKLAMEYMARSLFASLPIVIARPFNYTGPGHDMRFVIPKLVDHFQKRAHEIDLGNLDIYREYNDVRVVSQVYFGLLERGNTGEIYNIASGRAFSLTEVLRTLEALTNHAVRVNVNPQYVRQNEIATLRGSPEKIESLLGKLSHPSLEKTLDWMLHY